jgi:DNA-binding CsgD family transcriptional regulator
MGTVCTGPGAVGKHPDNVSLASHLGGGAIMSYSVCDVQMPAGSPLGGRGVKLIGRRAECDVLDQIVASVRCGESRALVLHGDQGAGKTALLEYLAGRAEGCRVARAAGVQSEIVRPDLARAHLLFGEWLRRRRRRSEAREHLRAALELLESMGMDAFANRARHELRATGETARKRAAPAAGQQLTAHEAQIAQLARDGMSNPEIGARLFLSPRTVQYHLGSVFAKLGISSRSQLDLVLPEGPVAV